MCPGRALVPYGCAGTPAVDNACTTARTMTTWSASVCRISGANVEDDEKSREKKRSHWLAPPIAHAASAQFQALCRSSVVQGRFARAASKRRVAHSVF
jgi:hypothetical protein